MTWKKTPADREHDKAVYQHPEYRRNKPLALKRANGRCEKCGKRTQRLAVDHKIPVTRHGGHDLANLQVLCAGSDSCHARKTATEGGGYRRPRTDPEPRTGTVW